MNINWFPGHMAKTLKNIEQYLKVVDLVIETADARIPSSSRNPELDKIIKARKPRLLLLNKADIADPKVTDLWLEHFKEQDIACLATNSKDRKSIKKIINEAKAIVSKRREENQSKAKKDVKIMIVGIPNTGKSTLINTIVGKKASKTSNRPGVTRGPQWVKTKDKAVKLLDMPGVLWPKLESETEQFNLAATGAIKDTLIPVENVAYYLFEFLIENYPEALKERYKLDSLDEHPYELYLAAAKNRGCIMSGAKVDENRFAKLLLEEFRNNKIARISLEKPE